MDDDDSLHHSALFFSKTNCSRTFRILRGKGEGQICPAHYYEISEFFPFFLLVHHPISTRHFDSCQLVPGDPPNPGKLCGVGGQNVGKNFVIYFRSRILKSNKVHHSMQTKTWLSRSLTFRHNLKTKHQHMIYSMAKKRGTKVIIMVPALTSSSSSCLLIKMLNTVPKSTKQPLMLIE